MEDLLDDTRSLQFLHKETPIWSAALFGGPLAAAFLIAHNFREVGLLDYVKKTWLIAVLVVFINVGVVFLTAFFGLALLTAAPLMNIAIANVLVTKYQNDFIEKHERNKGAFLKASAAVLPCIIGFVVYAIPMTVGYFILGVYAQS